MCYSTKSKISWKVVAVNSLLNSKNSIVRPHDQTKVLIQMTYDIPSTAVRRKFNLLRSVDESVSQTIRRLAANIEQAAKKKNKRRDKQNNKIDSPVQPEPIVIQLFDENNQVIDETQLNKQAWLSCRRLVINEQSYQVEYNAPALIKFRFPEIIMSNAITTAVVELDYGDPEHSLFNWYVADELKTEETDELEETIDDAQWIHVHTGPFCIFRDEHVNKFVRLACLPRNSSARTGMQAVHTSKTRIIPCPSDLPMNTRHQLTQDYLPIDSNSLRVVSYNILANGYAASTGAAEIMYPYCPEDHLNHDYRKPLLLKEILGYHADLIFLQECDTRFYERELSTVLKLHGYSGDLKIKSESVQEGEAIFYRNERFSAINTHHIRLGEHLRTSPHMERIRQCTSLVPNVNANLLERNTVLQVLALQPKGQLNEIFLMCNTHLHYHPQADIVRCFQSVIASEHIKEVKDFYEQQNKNVSIIWCGDFNSNTTSLAFHLLFSGALLRDPNHRGYTEGYVRIIEDFDYKLPLELSTYSNYSYTNYMVSFHAVIDHIFFETKKFKFHRCIPMPTDAEVTEFTALPSCKIPSDHLAIVMDLEMIK
ncbi:unnamed protein product [Adineta ricciae]|uniref:Endonuclease/exonuclease/phosphatase domain-containing protein n=1 Tax=Adineta ricciae TaxID=249248 RepID=A0A814XRC8_ADIRI|nr:unnamed protein product [Adineta ricciae]